MPENSEDVLSWLFPSFHRFNFEVLESIFIRNISFPEIAK